MKPVTLKIKTCVDGINQPWNRCQKIIPYLPQRHSSGNLEEEQFSILSKKNTAH